MTQRQQQRTLYHITDRNKWPMIERVGLLRGQPRASIDHGDIDGIYLCDDYAEFLSCTPDFVGRHLAIIEVDVSSVPSELLELDGEYDRQSDEDPFAFVCNFNIPAVGLKLLGFIDFTNPKRKGTSYVIPKLEK